MGDGDDHPGTDVLQRFAGGEASPSQGVAVVRHLLAGCTRCGGVLSATWRPGGIMESDAAAAIPNLDPDSFETYEGLRETTLAIFTDPEDNEALRPVGALLCNMAGALRPRREGPCMETAEEIATASSASGCRPRT